LINLLLSEENLALHKSAKATHASTRAQLPSFANDGDGNTYYSSDKNSDRAWIVDLGRVFQLREIVAMHPQFAIEANSLVCHTEEDYYRSPVQYSFDDRECAVSEQSLNRAALILETAQQ